MIPNENAGAFLLFVRLPSFNNNQSRIHCGRFWRRIRRFPELRRFGAAPRSLLYSSAQCSLLDVLFYQIVARGPRYFRRRPQRRDGGSGEPRRSPTPLNDAADVSRFEVGDSACRSGWNGLPLEL